MVDAIFLIQMGKNIQEHLVAYIEKRVITVSCQKKNKKFQNWTISLLQPWLGGLLSWYNLCCTPCRMYSKCQYYWKNGAEKDSFVKFYIPWLRLPLAYDRNDQTWARAYLTVIRVAKHGCFSALIAPTNNQPAAPFQQKSSVWLNRKVTSTELWKKSLLSSALRWAEKGTILFPVLSTIR